MTIDLRPGLEKLLQKQAEQSGLDTDTYVAKVLKEALGLNADGEDRTTQGDRIRSLAGKNGPAQDIEPFWRAFTARMHALPPEVFERLPADGASEHDHYLYGTPKKTP